jgi:hypothetical protein
MKRLSYLLFFVLGTGLLQADVIYSNLGSTSPFYDNSGGNTVASGSTDYSTSFEFTFTSNNYIATQAEFFINQTNGAPFVQASIYDDNGGIPGDLLYTSGLTSYTGPTDVVLPLVGSTPLIAGDNYWFTLDAPPSSAVSWYYNLPGVDGPEAYNPTQTGFIPVGSGDQGAFAITGQIAPAPEPLTTGLMLTGLAALAVLRRRS